MKWLLVTWLLFLQVTLLAQPNWFSLYRDSVALKKDAAEITGQFLNDVQKIMPGIKFKVSTKLNTQPTLIYYKQADTSINYPFWQQLIPEMKTFLSSMGGNEANGQKLFGLFFNGFYLSHELGHALQYVIDPKNAGASYQNEYFANRLAVLYWRKHGRQKELDSCYTFAKLILAKLPNPMPVGQTPNSYFTKNYYTAAEDPKGYGYMQFSQFIKAYEDLTLPVFDVFIREYVVKLTK